MAAVSKLLAGLGLFMPGRIAERLSRNMTFATKAGGAGAGQPYLRGRYLNEARAYAMGAALSVFVTDQQHPARAGRPEHFPGDMARAHAKPRGGRGERL